MVKTNQLLYTTIVGAGNILVENYDVVFGFDGIFIHF